MEYVSDVVQGFSLVLQVLLLSFLLLQNYYRKYIASVWVSPYVPGDFHS